jgi:hypothetical protein
LGAAYFLVAIKRVHGMRLLGTSWRRAAAVAVRQNPTCGDPKAKRRGDR